MSVACLRSRLLCMNPITIRRSTASDAPVLRLLAELDSAPPIDGPALIAESGDRPVAAISLDGRREIADPFVRTREVVALLRAANAA